MPASVGKLINILSIELTLNGGVRGRTVCRDYRLLRAVSNFRKDAGEEEEVI